MVNDVNCIQFTTQEIELPCDCCRKLHCLDQVNEGQGGQQGRENGISKHLAMQCNVSHSLCLSCECAGVANFLVGLLKGYKYMEQRQSTLKCANIKRGATKSTVSVEMRKDEQAKTTTATSMANAKGSSTFWTYNGSLCLTKCEICSIETI